MDYGLTLFQYFSPFIRTETSIHQLTQIWHCSERHTKKLVQKLQQQNLIVWEPTLGRGKKPFLTLTQTKNHYIKQLFQANWLSGKFEQAFQLLVEHHLVNDPSIQLWLNEQFGMKKNNEDALIFSFPHTKSNLVFDPLLAETNIDAHFISQIHETLFNVNEATGEVEGNLVFHYETVDFKQWRIVLRKGVFFHNLKPVTARDVKYSLERLSALAKPYFHMETISIIHDYELIIYLSNHFAPLPHLLASYRSVIIPFGQTTETIGCGPFVLKEYSEHQVSLQTFDHYFKIRPYIDGVDVLFLPNEMDIGISKYPYPEPIKQHEISVPNQAVEYIVLNNQCGMLKNNNVRQAIYEMVELDAPLTIPPQLQIHEDMPTLVIGYQFIDEESHHLLQAQSLKEQLSLAGIPCNLQSIDIHNVKSLDHSLDIYIGNMTIGKYSILPLLNLFLSKPKAILSLVDTATTAHILQKLDQVYRAHCERYEDVFAQLKNELMANYCLKILSSPTYPLYIRDDFIYKNLAFDDLGFVRYEKIYI